MAPVRPHVPDDLDPRLPEDVLEQQAGLVEHAHLQVGDRPALGRRQRRRERHEPVLEDAEGEGDDDPVGLEPCARCGGRDDARSAVVDPGHGLPEPDLETVRQRLDDLTVSAREEDIAAAVRAASVDPSSERSARSAPYSCSTVVLSRCSRYRRWVALKACVSRYSSRMDRRLARGRLSASVQNPSRSGVSDVGAPRSWKCRTALSQSVGRVSMPLRRAMSAIGFPRTPCIQEAPRSTGTVPPRFPSRCALRSGRGPPGRQRRRNRWREARTLRPGPRFRRRSPGRFRRSAWVGARRARGATGRMRRHTPAAPRWRGQVPPQRVPP